jgi:hypothetical protein
MADFCTNCHQEMGFPGEPDIDVIKESLDIEPGFMKTGYICESCGMVAIAKDVNGNIMVCRNNLDGSPIWDPYEV